MQQLSEHRGSHKGRTYKNKRSLNPDTIWSELEDSTISQSLSILEDDCRTENLTGILITRPVLEWRLCNLHRLAAKRVTHYNKKTAGMQSR